MANNNGDPVPPAVPAGGAGAGTGAPNEDPSPKFGLLPGIDRPYTDFKTDTDFIDKKNSIEEADLRTYSDLHNAHVNLNIVNAGSPLEEGQTRASLVLAIKEAIIRRKIALYLLYGLYIALKNTNADAEVITSNGDKLSDMPLEALKTKQSEAEMAIPGAVQERNAAKAGGKRRRTRKPKKNRRKSKKSKRNQKKKN